MEKKSAILLALLTAVVSGTSIYLNKFAAKGIDSDVFAFSKSIVVSLLLFSVVFGLRKLREVSSVKTKDWMKLMVIGLVGGAIPFILFFRGLQTADASVSSFIHKGMFVFVIALSAIFLKEKIGKWVLIGSSILFIGNYLLIKPLFSFGNGEFLILCATVLWAAETIMSKSILKDISGNLVAFSRMFFGSIFILSYLIAMGKAKSILSITSAQLSWIIITSILLFLYVITWYNSLKHLDASLATAVLLLGSPITFALSTASGSAITVLQVAGNAAIIIGIFVIARAQGIWKKQAA